MNSKKVISFFGLLVVGIAVLAVLLYDTPMPPYDPEKDWEQVNNSFLTEPWDIPPEGFYDWFAGFLIGPERQFLSEKSFDGTWYWTDDPGDTAALPEVLLPYTPKVLDAPYAKEIGLADEEEDYTILNVTGMVSVCFYEGKTYVEYCFAADPAVRYLVYEEDLREEWESAWNTAILWNKKAKARDLTAITEFFNEQNPW